MARKYTRDARGRFASGGGGGSSRPARKAAPTRAGNRLNRDNSGRITGIGRDGATARGGRLKTASGGRRATQTASLKSPGFRSGTIAKGGRGVSGSVARSLAATRKERIAAARPKPAPAKRTRPSGPAGSAAKPKGAKTGSSPARGAVKPSNKRPGGGKRWLSNDQVVQSNEGKLKGVRQTADVMRTRLPKKYRDYYGVSTVGGLIASKAAGRRMSFGERVRYRAAIESVTGVGRSQLQGVREVADNASRTIWTELSPVARKQAAIAEKVGNRKPRRRRR